MRQLLALALALASANVSVSPAQAQLTAVTEGEAERAEKVMGAIAALNDKRPAEALAILDPILAQYGRLYPNATGRVRCVNDDAQVGVLRAGTVSIGNGYCFALWAKGYVLIELARIPEAQAPLELAAALMPERAQFQSELG